VEEGGVALDVYDRGLERVAKVGNNCDGPAYYIERERRSQVPVAAAREEAHIRPRNALRQSLPQRDPLTRSTSSRARSPSAQLKARSSLRSPLPSGSPPSSIASGDEALLLDNLPAQRLSRLRCFQALRENSYKLHSLRTQCRTRAPKRRLQLHHPFHQSFYLLLHLLALRSDHLTQNRNLILKYSQTRTRSLAPRFSFQPLYFQLCQEKQKSGTFDIMEMNFRSLESPGTIIGTD